MDNRLPPFSAIPLAQEDGSRSSLSTNDRTSFRGEPSSSTANASINSGLGPSQVASVGFNNLKKVSTNTSLVSTLSTATTKSNALARLFTKNRSSSTINQDLMSPPQAVSLMNESPLYSRSNNSQDTVLNSSDNDTFDSYADESSDSVADYSKKSGSPSLFKLPKMNKAKLRFSGKPSASRPDLSIQTNGHHGLKVPKKILSLGLTDDSSSLFKAQTNRKTSMNSPVSSTFHSIFHRTHNHSQIADNGSLASVNDEGTIHYHQGLTTNPNRTTVCLSSSSSNSYITDISFAVVYNFTDPDYSLEDYDTFGEHNSLIDIHKKLLVPTDQFLLNKLLKSHPSEVGLGIISDDSTNSSDDYLNKYLIDFGKDNSKFFGNLLAITRPLFLPSHQKKLANGRKHPHLSMSSEDVANFIKDNYMNELISSSSTATQSPTNIICANHDGENKSPGKRDRLKKISTRTYPTRSPSFFSLNEIPIDDGLDDYRAREISQDLLTFFYRCFLTFRKDFNNVDVKHPISRRMSVPSSTAGGSVPKFDDLKLPQLDQLEKNWELLTSQWNYFNLKVRYDIVNMFYPLQKYLYNASIQLFNKNKNNAIQIEIESILLVAFKNIIITPVLLRRKELYDEFKLTQQHLPSTGQKPATIKRNPSSASSISFSPFDHQSNRLQRQNNITNNRHHATTVSTVDLDTLKNKERLFLKKNGDKVLNNLISIFGVIESYTQTDTSATSDGELFVKDNLFDETFCFLTEAK